MESVKWSSVAKGGNNDTLFRTPLPHADYAAITIHFSFIEEIVCLALAFCAIACNYDFFIHFLLLRLRFLGIIPCLTISLANLFLSDPWAATTVNVGRWLGDLSGLCL